ncbi:pentatricopeptide repeat-containing protein At5g59600 [Phalaenopsis equestris]|uniref:pentatricopeptide repeat-containing protein At5g59600 n=1 Tax=Phalaenopsis equestris TaxID=78828 RepID=UPI0009E650B1|nr:pentatricopeptide repeat-containing protein At5g59600 [Phalaenopsis equestris]
MRSSDLRRWIANISRSSRRNSHEETLLLFRQMQTEGFPPNRFILPTLLRSASNLSDSITGRSLHSSSIRSSLTSDPFISSSLIDFYVKSGRHADARRAFDEAPIRDSVVWNSIISGYASRGLIEEGMLLFREMQSRGPKPDLFTWNSLISGYAQSGDEQNALKLFDSMRFSGIEADVVSWTSIISGLVRNFNYRKGFVFFRRMVAVAGVRPSSATISSLLPASANVMDLRRGKEIHGYAIVSGFERDLFVSSSLIDMYSKCGVISDADRVFDEMPVKNTVSFNSMIFAHANHGRCEKAIKLFYQMKIYGFLPDHLTFTAVLTACSHGGKVKLGKYLFRFMQENHQIVPRMEHYASMVDLLGRAGKLLEAHDLINEMPMEPDSFVWGAMLGACEIHGDVGLSEIAARRLGELEPASGGRLCLLGRVMASAGRLGDAERMKKVARKKRLRRYLGCSWTQV